MIDGSVEIPRADAFAQATSFYIIHEFIKTRLWLLVNHCCGFDGPDLALGLGLRWFREGMDVIQDVGFGGYVKCCSVIDKSRGVS